MNRKALIFFVLVSQSIVAISQTNLNIWTKISCGGKHVVALMSDSTLRSWGYNGYGQSGTGDIFAYGVPTLVGTDNDWISLDAGYMHTLAMKSDHSIWGWGSNHHGQAGQSELGSVLFPSQIGSETDWKSIAAGNYSGHGIKQDGSLWSWGLNAYFILGINSTDSDSIATYPLQVGTDYDWDTLFVGEFICYALKTDGSLWAWGYNYDGQIPDATPGQIPAPVLVDNSGDWQSISSGHYQVCGIKNDGTLWVWGSNMFGAAGTGEQEDTAYIIPTQIGLDNNWNQIYAGYHHCLAIKNDGSIWGWGKNDSGALGQGTTTNVFAPIMLSADQNWEKIYAGENYSIIIDSIGYHFCAAGTNSSHQLGNCFLTSYETPFICNTVRYPIEITDQSFNPVFCNGSEAMLFVNADNDATQFWIYSPDNGVSWYGVPDNGTYTGLNTSELTITSIDDSFDNWQYKCVLHADCFSNDTSECINISVFSPNTNLSLDQNTLCADNLNASFQWYNCDLQNPISDETEICFTALESGSFAVIVEENECSDTSDCIYVQYSAIVESNNNVELFQTKVIDNIIQIESQEEFNIKILDYTGKLVLQKRINTGVNLLDFSENKPGIYLIECFSDSIHVSEKIIYLR